MKKLACFFTIVSLVMLFGCTKDILTDDYQELNLELKKANVPIPMKGALCMTADNEERIPVHFGSPEGPIVPGETLAKIAWLFGNATHLGKLGEESFMTCREGAYLDADAFAQGNTILYATYDARLFAANGDYIDGICNIRIDGGAQTLTADYTFNGGSGKYENAAGSGFLSGELHCWDVEGTLEY